MCEVFLRERCLIDYLLLKYMKYHNDTVNNIIKTRWRTRWKTGWKTRCRQFILIESSMILATVQWLYFGGWCGLISIVLTWSPTICNLDRGYDVDNPNLFLLTRCLCSRGHLICIEKSAHPACPRVPVEVRRLGQQRKFFLNRNRKFWSNQSEGSAKKTKWSAT